MVDPLILHIETSGSFCSVGLSRGSEMLDSINSSEENNHSTALAPDVQALLASQKTEPSDLHAISVSGGPGSYTGLRVGVSFAKAMCFALNIPLLAIDTLESLAMAARTALQGRDAVKDDVLYYPNIDARRMEVYVAAFDAAGDRMLPNSTLIVDENTFADLIEAGNQIVFCGTGTMKCVDILTNENIIQYSMQCKAEHLMMPALSQYMKGNFADLVAYRPDYVKPPNITVSKKPLF